MIARVIEKRQAFCLTNNKLIESEKPCMFKQFSHERFDSDNFWSFGIEIRISLLQLFVKIWSTLVSIVFSPEGRMKVTPHALCVEPFTDQLSLLLQDLISS